VKGPAVSRRPFRLVDVCKPDFVPRPEGRGGDHLSPGAHASGPSRGRGATNTRRLSLPFGKDRPGGPASCSVLHRTGFIRLPSSLSGRWALTPPFHPYPGCCLAAPSGAVVFCDTFRDPGLAPEVPRLAPGVLPCGVRTFLRNRGRGRTPAITQHPPEPWAGPGALASPGPYSPGPPVRGALRGKRGSGRFAPARGMRSLP